VERESGRSPPASGQRGTNQYGNIEQTPYLKSGDDEPKADSYRVDLRRRRREGKAWPRGRREAAAGG
jgi:hypothetical protein